MLSSSSFQLTKTRMAHQSPLHMMMRSKHERPCISTGWFHNFHQSSSRRSNVRLPEGKTPAPAVVVACSGHQLGNGDKRALETVLKLYTAIKSKSFHQLSDVIGEECLCICNFASTFQPFRGKEQVLDFFSSLMKNMGNNIEFIVQPTFHDGMNVGISWKLEWCKNHVLLGKGFSFYVCHNYQGKIVIRNVDMFLEPILHIEPFRLKTVAFLTNFMDNMCSRVLKGKEKEVVKILVTLILMAALFFFARHLFTGVYSFGVKNYWRR